MSVLKLDHVAHYAHELEGAARSLEALGFTVTSPSAQTTHAPDGALVPPALFVVAEDMAAASARWVRFHGLPLKTMAKLKPIHPGEILEKEFLEPLKISQYRLAVDIGVPPRRINEIVNGIRGITADTALRLGHYFGTSPQFWMNLQARLTI